MEQFKVDNFRAEHKEIPFPQFEELDDSRCREIRKELGLLLLNREGVDPLELVKQVAARAEVIDSTNAEDPSFSLADLLKQLALAQPNQVLLNWHRFDKIDKIGFSDLSAYFNDIWYPGADDLDIFDDSLNWIISIRHYGTAYLLRLRGI